MIFAFSKSNPAHLCNLWNRVQTVIRNAKSICNNQSPDFGHQLIRGQTSVLSVLSRDRLPILGTACRVSGMPLVERQYPFLSEHDYGIKGLPGLVFSFLESNPAHLCNLWNRVQTVIRDAKSITSHQVLDVRNY